MAATESAATTAPPPVADEKPAADKTEKLVRVEKPDEDTFKRDLTNAEKQLSAVQDKIVLLPQLNAAVRWADRAGGAEN
jgi:hypothetical protein